MSEFRSWAQWDLYLIALLATLHTVAVLQTADTSSWTESHCASFSTGQCDLFVLHRCHLCRPWKTFPTNASHTSLHTNCTNQCPAIQRILMLVYFSRVGLSGLRNQGSLSKTLQNRKKKHGLKWPRYQIMNKTLHYIFYFGVSGMWKNM